MTRTRPSPLGPALTLWVGASGDRSAVGPRTRRVAALRLVADMGMVREDGNTMTAQPHLDLDPKKMWTLDHLRRCPPCGSPNVLFNEMDDAGRAAFIEDYRKQGPAGRPAPATA